MDKLRKIGSWFWYNKERMVLIIMVIVLAYRVYGVISPAEPPSWPPIPIPQTELPETEEERQALGMPGLPPLPPTDGLPGTYTSFYERNPFWYYSDGDDDDDDDKAIGSEDLNIMLLKIQDVGGKPRAQLRTTSTTKWYSEGEKFEEFELVSIDPETESVVIYSERYSRQFTLEKQ
ncbi:MAG: hypothetical protein GXY07_00765 [Candidatus Hydrogenedentes bacterium]|jgi:hypothetical protein|nr:hypothetical protein [Candidatus Hydrogenedentota bacterium]